MNTLHSPFFSLYIMIFRIFDIFSSKNYTIKEKIINFAHIKLWGMFGPMLTSPILCAQKCHARCTQTMQYNISLNN